MPELVHYISKQESVKEIQDWFSMQFPFLKINFYENRDLVPEVRGSRLTIFQPESLLKAINPNMIEGELVLQGSMAVSALEIYFKEKLGLSVQILRKSGNLWLDTARTNSWSLNEQNSHGCEISPQQSNKTG